MANSRSSSCIGVVADFITRLIWVQRLDASCIDSILRLIPSCGWLQVVADSILRLTRFLAAGYGLQLIPYFGWLCVVADSIMRLTQGLPVGFDLRLTYTLIHPVNLRTYPAKYIIFIVCFLPADFSYHWFRLLLLLQEAWTSLKKPGEASRL